MTALDHLSDGQLRAHLDAELAADEARHLAACAECQARLAALAGRRASVTARFTTLAPHTDDPALAARPALDRFQTQYAQKEKVTMFKRLFSRSARPAWAALTAVAVLAASLAFEPVRAWAGQFLGLFRVQQVAVLPIDLDSTGLGELSGNSALGKQMSQLLSHAITVTKKPGDPQVVGSAEEASQRAGFTVRLPDNEAAAPQLTVEDSAAFQFVVDRARAQALLDEAGRSDLQLPASLDGATISVDIPAGVSAAYGHCPSPDAAEGQAGSPGRRYFDCVILAQIPSPTVDTPPDVDLAQLADIGLQFTGMTAEQARAFSQTVDWTSTLVIPIPRNGASYEEVAVDGVTGYLIQRPSDDAPQYMLVWVKDGIIYAVGGLGTDSARAIALANSLK